MGSETGLYHSMDGDVRTLNSTNIDPGGYRIHNSSFYLDIINTTRDTGLPETDNGIRMTIVMTTYTLIIILLSIVVLFAIMFVLFGLFMKASAFTHTDRMVSGIRNKQTGFDIDKQETVVLGPTGFGSLEEM